MYNDVNKFLDEGYSTWKMPIAITKDFEIKTSQGLTGIRTRCNVWDSKLIYLYRICLESHMDIDYVSNVYRYLNGDVAGRVGIISWESYTIDVHACQLTEKNKLKIALKAIKILKSSDVGIAPAPGDIAIGIPQGATGTGNGADKRAMIYKRVGMGNIQPDGYMYGEYDSETKLQPLG